VSQGGHLFEKTIGIIPLTQTSLSAMVLVGFGLGTLAAVALVGLIYPPEKSAVPPSPEILKRFEEEESLEIASLLAEKELRKKGRMPLGVWLEHSRWPVWLISIMGFSYIVYWFYGRGLNLNINILNFLLLFLALCLHDTPLRFMKSMERSTPPSYGIIVQFPFYAGIQGMLASSGLAAIVFRRFVAHASAATYPLWVFLDAAFINLFVPTSEGIWGIQGSLVIKTAQDLNAAIPRAISAFTAGEVIGNLIQPFWAIPLLSICGLSLRHIMGYCLLAFILLSLLWLLCVTLVPL
jgi:short-chain fatty acids transporter